MVLGECGDVTVKLLWFSCCRLRLVPHGWQRSSGETGFPRKRTYCSGPVWVLPRRLWSRGEVASFEDGSDPPKRPWGRGRAYCSGPARARRGGLWGAWSGTPFEVGLGLAEAAVDSGRGHIAQDQLGTCQDDRGGGVGERHTVRSSTSGPAQTSPLWIREWLRRSVLGRPDS